MHKCAIAGRVDKLSTSVCKFHAVKSFISVSLFHISNGRLFTVYELVKSVFAFFFSQSLHCRSLTLLCCTLCFLFVCFFCFTALFLYEIIELFETGFKLSHRAPGLLGGFWWLFINVLHFPEFVERDKFLLLMIHSLTYFFIGLRLIYTILYSDKL